MTPKERAVSILDEYKKALRPDNESWKEEAKQCALIAVNEIIGQWEYIDTYLADMGGELNLNLKYWISVKKELELLN
jgi:hypothetical protein